jgi:hypothetical protein
MRIHTLCLIALSPALLSGQNLPTASAESAPLTVLGKVNFHRESVYRPVLAV